MMRVFAVWICSSVMLLGVILRAEEVAQYPPVTVLPAKVQVLSPIEAYGFIKLTPRVNLIDLRDAWELEGRGSIEGAARMSYMEQTFRQHFHMAVLREEDPILLYCALGTRGRRAALVALELGYQEVYLIRGGFRAWIQAGLPVKR